MFSSSLFPKVNVILRARLRTIKCLTLILSGRIDAFLETKKVALETKRSPSVRSRMGRIDSILEDLQEPNEKTYV